MSSFNESTTPETLHRNRWQWPAILFAALLILTLILHFFDLDRMISGAFYRQSDGWFLAKQPLWVWLHKYGPFPGVILAVGCLLLWLTSYFAPSLNAWRKPCLVVVLTTVLTAGVLVNAILKQYWGRPRPSQTIEYGGHWEYRPIFPPGTPGKGAAFPSGHSSMGFVFLGAAAFHRRSKILAVSGVTTGVILGSLLSVGRVVQGSHFPTDVLWSFGLVGITVVGLILYLPEAGNKPAEASLNPKARAKKRWLTIGIILAILILATGLLTCRPYFGTRIYSLKIPAEAVTLQVLTDQDPERLTVLYRENSTLQLQVDAHGFSWIKRKYQQSVAQQVIDKELQVKLDIETRGYFTKLDHTLTLTLPIADKEKLYLELNGQPIER